MRGRREHLRSFNRSERDDLRPRHHFAEGGDVTSEEVHELERLYPGITKRIQDWGTFETTPGEMSYDSGSGKSTYKETGPKGSGYGADYIKALEDAVLKDLPNDEYLKSQLDRKDYNFLQNQNFMNWNSEAGGAAKHASKTGQDRDTALKRINQNYINSQDADVQNNGGVKYLNDLYAKAQDPNASWTDVDNAIEASNLLDQGFDRSGSGWKKDTSNILESIRDIPVVGDIAKATGVDRMAANMSDVVGSKNFGEGLRNLANFGIDAAGTVGGAIANPSGFAAGSLANLAADKLLPKQAQEEPADYEQDYGDATESPHVSQMMNPTAPSPTFIGSANQPYLSGRDNTPVTENFGYMTAEQRGREHKSYDQGHSGGQSDPSSSPSQSAPGSPAPQASPPPPAVGTTAPPGITKQQQSANPEQSLKGGGTVGHSFYKELHSMRRSHGGGTDHWIQKALPPSSRGKLHENLHIPSGQKIPMKRLMQAEHSHNPTIRKEAQLADRLRHFHHGCR